MAKDTLSVIEQLKNVTGGLLYMSESDYPFEVFLVQPAQQDTVDKLPPPDARVLSVDEFFERLTREQEWHGDFEKENVQRYRAFKQELVALLNDLKVYRWGEIEISILITGATEGGDKVGIATKAIET